MDDASHWIEGAVQIRVRHGNTEGWYPIHYPVTAEFWFNAGRAVGLPKRHAGASILPQGTGWTATATPRGTSGGPSMSLAWQPAGGQAPAALQRAYRIPTDPLLVLNSPLRGPELSQTQYILNKPQPFQALVPGSPKPYSDGAPPDGGLVSLDIRPNLDALQEPDLPKIFPAGTDLSDMVVPKQTVPGTHAYFALTLGSQSKTLGQGGYRTKRSVGPEPSARPACARRKTVTFRARVIPGVRIRRLRAYVNGRKAAVRLLKGRRTKAGRRVRVSLRRSKARRLRVSVVVHQRRGFKTKTTKRYRRCR